MGKTSIEWATDTWNPVTGCTKVSEGCRNCYAERMVKRFSRAGIGASDGLECDAQQFEDVLLHPERLDQPLRWRKPRRVFVCSMSDLFHPDVPDEFIAGVFGVMAACPQHTFIVLTKRPKRMLEWFGWLKEMAEQTADANREPMRDLWTMHVMMSCARNYGAQVAGCRVEWPLPNVIGMVSVEDQKAADERVVILLQSPFAMRGVSYEPALGPVELWALSDGSWHDTEGATRYNALTGAAWYGGTGDHGLGGGPKLDLVICGGETGPGAHPAHPDWFRTVRDQCRAAGVPFFMKQMHVFRCPVCGTCSTAMPEWNADECDECTERARRVLSKEPEEWPEDLRIREVPSAQG